MTQEEINKKLPIWKEKYTFPMRVSQVAAELKCHPETVRRFCRNLNSESQLKRVEKNINGYLVDLYLLCYLALEIRDKPGWKKGRKRKVLVPLSRIYKS